MKKLIKNLAVIGLTAFLFSSCTSTSYIAQPAYQDPGPVTYQSFYDNLSPYGNWISYPGYGHVWAPNAEAGFRPYATNGQWRYSNEGWAWQSNYTWGWAPFHYGRWLYDDNYGWLWVPGYDWSPAWVTWGSVDNYYAWAPLMPEVNVGVQYSNWRPHAAYWNVVPREHISDRNIQNVIVRNTQINNNTTNTTVINNTNITKNITIINNYNTSRTNNYYAKGPDVHEVERYTKNTIQPVEFKEVNQIHKPNQQSNIMEVYRPVVQNPAAQNTGSTNQNNYSGRPADVNNRPGTVPNTGANNAATNVYTEPHPANQENNHGTQPVNTNNSAATPRQQQTATPDQYQDPRHSQNLPPAQPSTPVQNTPQVRNEPQAQNLPVNQNSTPQPQPRKFRTVTAAQTMPIREESQVPVVQPRQQRRNVEQLPVQRAEPFNNSNFNNNRVQRPVDNRRP